MSQYEHYVTTEHLIPGFSFIDSYILQDRQMFVVPLPYENHL